MTQNHKTARIGLLVTACSLALGCQATDLLATAPVGSDPNTGAPDLQTQGKRWRTYPSPTPTPTYNPTPTPPPTSTPVVSGYRGFPNAAPWASCYGTARQMGDLSKAASTFRILNIDADPGCGNFTTAQITQLKASGRNKILSYFNLGSCENWRTYWSNVPSGFVSAGANTAAHLGSYQGYPDETWMDVGNADYQNLIVNYVAPRLVAQGVDGFYFDNLEIVEHSKVSASTRQGGLDLVRKLREKYPNLLFVMQNATSNVTRLGITGGVPFPSLLDGIAHEEVYKPTYDSQAESELLAWKSMNLRPGGQAFWIGTEDYVGSATDTTAAKADYDASRAKGFSPYVADASAGQQTVYYWPF